MAEAISFFRAFEIWIYAFLGLVGLFYVRKFILSWGELRIAGFGLERDNAQARLNQSAIILVLLLMMAVGEFVLVTFVAPSLASTIVIPTPTISLLMTATATSLPGPTLTLSTLTDSLSPAGTLVPTAAFLDLTPTPGGGCLPSQIEITSPQNGQEVSNVVEVLGAADIPNFGFYKIEMKLPSETNWLTIQAGNAVVSQGKLGDWDTRRLPPGEYQLGLVVIDNQARISPPCVVTVRVVRSSESTLTP
jgi:hypothetical protein